MEEVNKLPKLISKVRHLIYRLDSHNHLRVHSEINQFYYMERVEELEFLLSQLASVKKQSDLFEAQIQLRYVEVATNWRRDHRWLTRHLSQSAIQDRLSHA